jgi:hypothetical protein
MQFGNDDVASKVWVMVRASLVSLFGVSDGAMRYGVEAAVECPYGNDDRQPVACGGIDRRKPCIFLLRSSSSKLELSLVNVCD